MRLYIIQNPLLDVEEREVATLINQTQVRVG
jgi:hypothetical protein